MRYLLIVLGALGVIPVVMVIVAVWERIFNWLYGIVDKLIRSDHDIN
jgi:hypothetical protein